MDTVLDKFRLDGKVVLVTGGSGLLGQRHAQAVAQAGGVPVLWDISPRTDKLAGELAKKWDCNVGGIEVDITSGKSIDQALQKTLDNFGRVDVLINNAARDPKVSKDQAPSWSRLENFGEKMWQEDLAVGLTGAYLCSRAVGSHLARNQGGVILNIASDLGVIAPDQRIYRQEGLPEEQQPVKPVTYSVIKHGLIGLTKYLATYWADKNIRVNSLAPGGVYTNQPDDFVARLTSLIPMGRMAKKDEYQAAVLFLISDASSYMTGANLSIDGGRTCW